MLRPLLSSLCVLYLLGGCATSSTVNVTPSSSHDASQQAQCEKTGGSWRPATGMCEKAQDGGY